MCDYRQRKTELQRLLTIYRRAVQVRCGCTWARCISTSPKKCCEGSLSPLERSRTNFFIKLESPNFCADAFVSIFLFSQIEGIQLMMDSETGRSKGYGFISVNRASVFHLQCCGVSEFYTHHFVFCSLQMQNVQKRPWSS